MLTAITIIFTFQVLVILISVVVLCRAFLGSRKFRR